MCTLTWRIEKTGYEVFFNRDELRTRLPEQAPALRQAEGYQYIAPEDGDHHGTWLAVNTYGVTYALLNYYDRDKGFDGVATRSRGLLPQLLAALRAPELDSLLEHMGSLEGFRPFHFVALVPDGRMLYWAWDGGKLKARPLTAADCPLTTSSFQTEAVVADRRKAYRKLGSEPDSAALLEYHRGTSALGAAFGVCMQRPDAQTMSTSHIVVTETKVHYHYQRESRDGHSCELSVPIVVERQG
mgnify:CR=1 FL=1